MLDFDEFSDYADIEFEELSDEEVDKITSYAAFHGDDNIIKVLLLDDEMNVIARREFDDIDVAEVFLEEYFDDVEIEFVDEDMSEFLQSLDESMSSALSKIKRKTELFIKAVGEEARQSKSMAKVFFSQLKSLIGSKKPSEQELKGALEQLKSLNKFALTVALFALPMGAAAVYFVQKIANKYGYSIFPNSFDRFMQEMIVNHQHVEMINEQAGSINMLPYKGFGITRTNMPQLDKQQTQELISIASGIYGVEEVKLPVNVLKLSQNDVNNDKINLDVESGRKIIVSDEYYILDGHHYVLSLYNKDPDSEVDAVVVNTDFLNLYNLAKSSIKN